MGRRWERWKDPWDREYARRGRLWRGVASAEFLSAHVPRGARALELGCGDGKFLAGLVKAGYAARGLDRSRHALRLAAGLAPLVRGDVRRLPMPDASVDLVCARYVLGSLRQDERKEAAGEIGRVVRPEGWVLVEEFSRDDFRYGNGTPVEPHTFERNQGIVTHYYEPGEVESAFDGFRVLESGAVRRGLRIAGVRQPRVALRVLLQAPDSSRVRGP